MVLQHKEVMEARAELWPEGSRQRAFYEGAMMAGIHLTGFGSHDSLLSTTTVFEKLKGWLADPDDPVHPVSRVCGAGYLFLISALCP